MTSQPHDTVPGLESSDAVALTETLQSRLVALLDLHLALKHIHWNVVGPSFLSVHQMLDDQVGPVRDMSDELAERIATLGGQPDGNPQAIVDGRDWDDYPLGRDTFLRHLHALDGVYSGVISSHREAITATQVDPITEDILIGQTRQLELFQWFVRSFVERAGADDESITEPGPATAAADARGAHASHEADRAPTADEAHKAEDLAAQTLSLIHI